MDIPVKLPPLDSSICKSFSPEPSLENLGRAEQSLASIDITLDNEEVRLAQVLGVAAAIQALEADKNFLLADGMGMGKTVQAVAIAKALIGSGKFKACVVVVAPGGNGGWTELMGETQHQLWSRAKADKLANELSMDTLLIIDEIHGFKGTKSSKGGMLSTYRRPDYFGSVTCPILGMSGTLTDKPSDLANYATYLELDTQLNPTCLLNTATENGQLAMRSLEYPDFGVTFSKYEVDITGLGEQYREEYGDINTANLFSYTALLEREYLLNHLQADLEQSLANALTPIILTSQSDKMVKDSTSTITDQIAEVVSNAGCTPITLINRPMDGELDQLISSLKQEGKIPAIIGTMQSLGTGANLQDIDGSNPRHLIVTGITMEVNQLVQACYRVLRPNSKSIPTITFPISNHPIHKFALGCIAAKLQSHPNKDATFRRLQAEMGQITPLAFTLEDSAIKLLQLDPTIFTDHSLAWCMAKAAHIIPTVPARFGARYKIDPSKLPGFYDQYLLAQKDDRLQDTLNVGSDGSVFCIRGELKTSWLIFLERVLHGSNV